MATTTTDNDNNTTANLALTTTTTNATVNLNNSSGNDDVTTDGTGSTTINANNSSGDDTFDIDSAGVATVNLNSSTGDDDVSITGTTVIATANLNNSAGDDTITIAGSINTNATVNLNNSGGNDNVSIGSSTGATTATVNLNISGGTDIINVTGLTTTATVNLANSTGLDDFVELKGAGSGTINAVNSTGNDTLLGENSTDTITGGVGNDTVYLKGAGTINAGAGNDLGVCVLSDHYTFSGSTLHSINGDVDYYYGQGGTNTLVLVLTPAQLANSTVMADINNYIASVHSNPYTFHFGAGSGALVVKDWQNLVIQDTSLGLTPVKTLVGSAGAATVGFVVSGINEAGTGTLIVTDDAQTATETVTANGTFTFNLSGNGFADGSVTSSLTFTDGIGNTFTASGAAVTLDKDVGETATLSLTNTLVGSAKASAVSFTISGLDAADTGPGNTGTVSFVEGGQTVTVGVTGDGTYTANLSALPDGRVTSSLTFTDVAGNSFSASTSVAVDPDFNQTATLTGATITLGSVGASAAAFVVSGLDETLGASGLLTLSEGTSTATVTVTGDGTYTANLSGFADGTVNAALAVTDTAGNSFSASTSVAVDPDFNQTATLTGATITLGSVGASAAAFVVSGLDETLGASGLLTLSEGTSTATVTVTGDGTYTANLSGFADGTVNAALAVTDTAGNSFSASTSVAVDPDFNQTATLTGATITLGSVGASAAAFVVSGLDETLGASGLLTLSEGTSTATVTVTGDGTYTANLSGFADGTVNAALAVTDTAGNSFSASTSVAVDPDFNQTATLTGATITLGSVGASAAAFVVSGLDETLGASGLLTLSEGTSTATVTVTGDGTYTANLSGFADGTVNAALAVTDTAGNSFSASTSVAVDPDFNQTATLTGATITLGSVGASAAAFVVSGLDETLGASGLLTLSEGTSTATVTVTGDGTYTANLSGFADGTVNAALAVTDTAGNSFSASTSVAVDPDFNQTATLTGATITLGSVGASAAAFVVSGLDETLGASGLLTLSEGTSTATVTVTGDGTYTANLSGFADGTVNAALAVTDTAGNSFSASTSVAVDPDFNQTATLTGATITLGSVGASAAAFVVSGLDETLGASGLLTLSEGTSTATVTVTGDGTYTANLSGFADGTVNAALAVTDTAGNSFSASTSVAVDPDFNQTATLTGATITLGSVGASAAAFVVSGLDETLGASGLLTLSEGTSTATVTVTGDGTYTANLSGFADGTVNAALAVTDTAGNSFSASTSVAVDPDFNQTATLTGATITLGSVGASAAAFVVSGLDETLGASGLLTLSEGTSTATVTVTGDGTYTANLSGFADGTVNAALAVTDTAGNSFSASTSVAVDPDFNQTATLTGATITLGSVGASAAAFVVSGLDETLGASGLLTLSEGTSTATVTVTGDGTYTANLSGFADGTVNAALAVTDTAGNSFSASTSVAVDPDFNQTATLSLATTRIGSASAGAVSFTISGLDAGDTGAGNTGTVNFVDGTQTVTVGVTGNGTYSVNLSALPDATVTDSLIFTDAAGNHFSATGSSVTLDQDTGEHATLALAVTTIGSASAGAVSFTVSGLDAGDTGAGNTGTVSFVDGTQTVTVGVTGNGTYSANLSGLPDATVTDSLTFTDVAGNTFATTGPSVTLDQDTGEHGTLALAVTTIGSASAGAVSFTVSGLDAGDTGAGNTGTVSFVDGTQTVTVGVTGNGTYSANLSGLPDATVTDSLTFTDAAGNTFATTGPSVTLDQDTGEHATLTLAVTTIGSASAGAVSFTVNGLDAGDTGAGNTGTVSFVDGTQTVTVGVTGNGTYSANLSALPDATVTDSLTFTDAAGNAFATTGPNVTLDKDTGETATLTIGDPTETVATATATFTISGLEAADRGGVGNTGTASFVEGTQTVTVGVTGDGTYTANLSNLGTGTVTSSLSFSDVAGNQFSAHGNSVTITGTPLTLTITEANSTGGGAQKHEVIGTVADVFSGTIALTVVDTNQALTFTATAVESTANTPVTWSVSSTLFAHNDTVSVTATDGHGDTVVSSTAVSGPAGIAGSPINMALTDPAAGESVTVTVADVPTGWSLNSGTNNNGTWTVVTTDPSTLAVTTPATFAGASVLSVSENWTNADGSTGSVSVSDNVEVYPTSPIFAVSGDDTLTGAGTNDEFVFAQPIGNDTVYNFNAASDQIDLIGFGISGFAALQSSIADDANGNAVVTLGQNETITLVGINAAALSASNFVFDQEPVSTNTATMSVGDGAILPLGGTIDNTGTIAIDSTGDQSDLEILVRGATLQGGGQVVLSDNSQNIVFGGDPSAVLTNVDNTISGAGQLGAGQLTLDNEGMIDATGTNALVIDTGANTVTNSGTLEATGTGGLDIKSALANSGTLWANGGNVTVEGAETGGGTAEISGNGILDFGAASDAVVSFDATATGTLKLDQSANFSGTVAGLGQGDSLDLADVAFGAGTTVAYSANAAGTGGTLTVSDGTHTANLALLGQYAAAGFQTSADQGGGTVVIYSSQVAQQTLLTNPQQHA